MNVDLLSRPKKNVCSLILSDAPKGIKPFTQPCLKTYNLMDVISLKTVPSAPWHLFSNFWSTVLAIFIFLSMTPSAHCQNASLMFTQPEEQPIGHPVGSIASYSTLFNMVEADDRTSLRYSFLSDASGSNNFFRIDAVTGNISFAQRVDRETLCRQYSYCELNFQVAVSGNNNFFTTVAVKVNLTDVNDNSPKFPSPGVMEFHISETASENLAFTLTPALDADSNLEFGVQAYTLEPASDHFVVEVARNSGDASRVSLVLTQRLDRELIENLTLRVVARDGGDPSLSGTLTVKVIVDDVNDNDPKFSENIYSVEVSEEDGPGYHIVTVIATDLDVGDNGKVMYKLNSVLSDTSADAQDKILVDSNTGVVTLTQSLVNSKYRIIVEAYDLGTPSRSTQAVVLVTVLDTLNNSPKVRFNYMQIDNLPFGWVSEGSKVGTVVAVLHVEDLDSGPNGTVTCESLEPDFQIQLLEPKRYKLVLARPLDRESNSTCSAKVICKDQGTPSLNDTASIVLNVSDINDKIPVFANAFYVQGIVENNINGSLVIVVSAADEDEGQNSEIEYRLVNDSGNFRIMADSGIITANRRFDREELDLYTIQVLAVDKGVPPLTGTASLTVTILDLHDEKPTFSQQTYKFQVFENKDAGSLTGNVTATDPDLGSGAILSLSLKPVEGKGDVPFVINSEGQISNTETFDREEKDLYSFYVIATDHGSPAMSSSAQVVVEILDTNDMRPTFLFPSSDIFTIYVSVPASQDVAVIQIDAHDGDSDDNQNNVVTFSMTTSNTSNPFTIDLTSGQIFPTRNLMASDTGTYILTVNATDQGIPAMWDVRTIVLVLQSRYISTRDAMVGAKVLIVSCIVCFTAIVSGAILVVICLVRRHDMRQKVLRKSSLFPRERPDMDEQGSGPNLQQRHKMDLGQLSKNDPMSYHQHHHHNYYTSSDTCTTARPSGHASNPNHRGTSPLKSTLTSILSGQGCQVTESRHHTQDDYLSTSSTGTTTGDSGHGSDEDMVLGLDQATTSIGLATNGKRTETFALWRQTRTSSNPPTSGRYLVQLPPRLTNPHTVSGYSSTRFDTRNIHPNKQLARIQTSQTTNHSSSNTPTALPPRMSQATPAKNNKPPHVDGSRSTTPSTLLHADNKSNIPVPLHSQRQISFVSQPSLREDIDDDEIDLNTTTSGSYSITSGSYSITSEDVDTLYSRYAPPVSDMYV